MTQSKFIQDLNVKGMGRKEETIYIKRKLFMSKIRYLEENKDSNHDASEEKEADQEVNPEIDARMQKRYVHFWNSFHTTLLLHCIQYNE